VSVWSFIFGALAAWALTLFGFVGLVCLGARARQVRRRRELARFNAEVERLTNGSRG
jgi:membrane associated rhomboid family serine protease